MTPRTVAILLVCAVVSTAAAVFGAASRIDFQDTNFEGQRLFPSLLDEAKDVAEVVVVQQGNTMTFERKDGQWTLRESDNYPVHPNLVSKVVFSLANMELLQPKTAKESRYEDLQLGDPSVRENNAQRVTLKNGGGTVMADLIVGKANYFLPETTTGGMYVRRPGEAQTWLVRGLVDIGVEPRDWLVRDIVDVEPENIARVEVTHPDGEKLIVVPEQGVTGDFSFENLPEGMKLTSEFAPRNIAAILKGFVLNNVQKAGAVQLDPAQAYVSEYTSKDGISVTLKMWQVDKTQYMTVDASYAGDDASSDAAKQAAAIVERTKGWVYIIPEYQFNQVAKKMAEVTEKADSGS